MLKIGESIRMGLDNKTLSKQNITFGYLIYLYIHLIQKNVKYIVESPGGEKLN